MISELTLERTLELTPGLTVLAATSTGEAYAFWILGPLAAIAPV